MIYSVLHTLKKTGTIQLFLKQRHRQQHPLQMLIFTPVFKSVLQTPHHMNGPAGSQPEHESSASSLGILVALAGVAAVCAFIYMRNLRKPF